MKKILFLIAIIASSINAIAQVPSWEWAKSAGGGTNDSGTSSATDASGNVYIAGEFSSPTIVFGSYTLTNVNTDGNYSDIFIAKYDATGNVLWAKSVGAKIWSTVCGTGVNISTDIDGNVFLASAFVSSNITLDTTLLIGNSYYNIFVVKYDSTGNVLWAKSAGGNKEKYIGGITTDNFGNVCIAGTFSESAIFGTTTLTGGGIFIVKYNPNGNVIWAKKATSYGFVDGISADLAGNIYITGTFSNDSIVFDTTTLVNAGCTGAFGNCADIFVVKYDPLGDFMWAKSFGGTSYDFAGGIKADANENVFVSAYSYNSAGGDDVIVVKYNTLGNVVWSQSSMGGIPPMTDDCGMGITTDANGNVYVTGFFVGSNITFGNISTGFITLNNNGYANTKDVFVVKYTSLGSLAWAISVGEVFIDNGSGISVDINGNVYVTGNYFDNSSINFGNTTLLSAGRYDVYLAKLSCATSTFSSINPIACNSYTSPSGNQIWTSTGTYQDVIPNATGCDSIISVNLTINSSASSKTITVCDSYISPSGNYTWASTGIYHDTIPNSKGCDSIMTINLTIINIDSSVTQNGNILTATTVGANYQWLDCDNGFAPITNEINQIFASSSNGNYAVAITSNGCTDTSTCYTITGTGINQLVIKNEELKIYPNPNDGKFQITDYKFQIEEVRVYNLLGEEVKSLAISNKSLEISIDVSSLRAGIYFVQVRFLDVSSGSTQVKSKKFIKE